MDVLTQAYLHLDMNAKWDRAESLNKKLQSFGN